MVHHDGRDYDVAAGETAAKARVKMEEIVQSGLASAESVYQNVLSRVITDKVVKAPALRLVLDDDASYKLATVHDVSASGGSFGYSSDDLHDLHPNAFDQLFKNVGLSKEYESHVVKEAGGQLWGKELITHNVNEIIARRSKQRNLLRVEGGEGRLLKGFLSDKFRRLDSRPLLDAFMGASAEIGLVPVQGVASDTKVRMRAIMPQVFEPIENEVMLFGVEWGNSDYGDGGHSLSLFVTRVWCTNMAMGDTVLRQVHVGKTLSDDIEYSRATYESDTRTNVLALQDTVRHAISPKRVNTMLAAIKAAGKEEVNGKGIEAILAKMKGLNKADKAGIMGLYEGPDTVNLPEGQTLWRLSNAMSFFAQAKGIGPDKKLELEGYAGALIPHKAEEAVAV